MRRAVLVVLLIGGQVAHAQPEAPAITVRAGSVLPMFILYEYPGAMAAGTFAWRVHERIELVATTDLGVLVTSGATRFLHSLGVGARITQWRCWAQLGLGVTGYVERIGVVLPARTVRTVDRGAALTADLAIGFRITPKLDFAIEYDHQLAWTGPNRRRDDHETLPHVGTALATFGWRL